jgi:MFS family permease
VTENFERSTLLTPLFVGFFFVEFLSFFGFQMLNTQLSMYVTTIGGGNGAIGLASCAMTAAIAFSRPVAGALLDSYGKRKILIPAQACIIFAALAHGFAGCIPALIAVRAMYGFSWAFSDTALNAIVAGILPRKRIGTGMGIFTIAIGLSMSIAPAIGFSVSAGSGFHNLFKLCAAAAAGAMALSIFICRSDGGSGAAKGPAKLFLPSSLPYGLLIGSVMFVSSSIASFIPLYAMESGAHSAVPFFTLSAITSLIARPMVGRLVDSHAPRTVIFPSLLILAFSCLALAAAPFRGWMLLVAATYGISFGSLLGGLQAITLAGASRDNYGAAIATFFLCFDIGNGIGPLFAGQLANRIGFGSTYGTIGILVCALAFSYALSTARKAHAN